MLKDTFLHTFRTGGIFKMGRWALFIKPRVVLIDLKTEEEIVFENLLDAYENAVVDGKPLKEIVAEREYKDIFGNHQKDGDCNEEYPLLLSPSDI